MDAISNFLTGNSGGIGSALGTGAQLYGQQNAGEALTKAAGAAANTQTQYLGTAGNYYQPYLATGASAANALTQAQSGGAGGTPDYSGFENMPGYQFAVQQGTQAIQRNAAAQGNAWTPNTAQAVGQYVTGTAMQDYNTYIQQLQQSAGIGATAANQIGNMTYNTGANISQLQENAGQAQAGLYTGMGQTVGGALGAGNPYYGSGVYGSGGATSGVAGLVGSGLKALGGWLGSGSSNSGQGTTTPAGWNGTGSSYSGYTNTGYASGMDSSNPWASGGDTSDSLYVPGAGQGGNADYTGW
jgi:hypothetical protein